MLEWNADTPDMKQISDAIRKFRLDKHWHWKRLADYVGIPVSTIFTIGTGRVEPRELSLNLIRKAIPAVDKILRESECEPQPPLETPKVPVKQTPLERKQREMRERLDPDFLLREPTGTDSEPAA